MIHVYPGKMISKEFVGVLLQKKQQPLPRKAAWWEIQLRSLATACMVRIDLGNLRISEVLNLPYLGLDASMLQCVIDVHPEKTSYFLFV